MMERMFEGVCGDGRLEQLEAGVTLEHCEPIREIAFDEDDSDLLFGSMEIPACTEPVHGFDQQGIAGQLGGADLIREIPALSDLLPPACGTSVMDVEYLLEMQEASVEVLQGASLTDITQALAQDCRVLCTIRMSGLAGDAAHAQLSCAYMAEVRGMDLRDPDAPTVCLQSFGREYALQHCSLEAFIQAWSACGSCCYVIDGE